MRKKIVIAVGIVVGLCIIGAGTYAVMAFLLPHSTASTNGSTSGRSKLTPVSVCDDTVITNASTAIANNDLTGLTTSATQVMAIGQYTNDPNCEYIVARYYLASGQADKASTTIDQLQRVLSAGGTYSTTFNPPAVNISDLRSSLAALQQQQSSSSQQVSGDELNKVDAEK